MHVLVKRIPGIVFVLLTLTSLILGILKVRGVLDFEFPILNYFWSNVLFMASLWYLSMNAYFHKELQWQKTDYVNGALIVVMVLSLVILVRPEWRYFVLSIALVGLLYVVIKLMEKVAVLFEERSSWFLALELLFPVYGMSTLTAEVQRWEKTKKNEF
ncbi:MAG: hypothetical protein Crog4KO_01430 [Crocinitomicaceae bacterium]